MLPGGWIKHFSQYHRLPALVKAQPALGMIIILEGKGKEKDFLCKAKQILDKNISNEMETDIMP